MIGEHGLLSSFKMCGFYYRGFYHQLFPMVQKKILKELTTILGSFCLFIMFAESLLIVVGNMDCSIGKVFFCYIFSRILVK